MKGLGLASGLFAGTCAVVLLGAVLTSQGQTPAAAAAAMAGGGTCTLPTSAPVTGEQRPVAEGILTAAAQLDVPRRGITVAIAAALTESGMRALNYGDVMNGVPTTSRGPFQQLAAWGPLEDRLHPVRSSLMFFNGGAAGQPGLLDIPGWQQLPVHTAAQAVEKSQFADGSNYLPHVPHAEQLSSTLICQDPTPVAAANGLQQNTSQDPSSFGWVRASNIVPTSWDGRPIAGGVAAGTAPLWTGLLTELAPHIPGGITSIGGYENRANVNNPNRASFHAYGLALDINAAANCNGCDPTRTGPGIIPAPIARQLAAKYGMQWGGDFRGTPDPMHFEIHLDPAQVAQLTGQAPAGGSA